jgi:glycosyltransferase involved in cell wall biosynthesis
LIPEKKVDLLIRAFALALDALPAGSCLRIVGSGPSKSHLRAVAETLGVSHRVTFLDAIYDQSELADQFNRTFVHVSPGYCGLSVVQSLAFGVPVVVAEGELHSPEVEALIPGQNSEWFRRDDAQDLASKLAMFSDMAVASSYGESGHSTVLRTHSIESMADAFCAAIAYATSEADRRAKRYS